MVTANLPNLSFMMTVGQLRYTQAICESGDYRNPDAAVGAFLSLRQRAGCVLRGKLRLDRLRADPFYHYVLARTKYYDEVFLDAIYDSVSGIVNIGCGTDTRAYRFAHILKQKRIRILECDQADAIAAKRSVARRCWPTDHVEYLALDLNKRDWTAFETAMERIIGGRVLVMMEGVSPYVSSDSFEAFLRYLSAKLMPGSSIAYDYKLAGAVADFGKTDVVTRPFRHPADRTRLDEWHRALDLAVVHAESSLELTRRMLPDVPALFDQDGLLRLRVAR